MTNTKFRKRALLSAVAMLLVALVALGSATFAWFTNNPTAVASGMKIHTSTSAGLVARAETDTRNNSAFSHDTILRYDSTADATNPASLELQPASFDLSASTGTNGALTFKAAVASDVAAYAKNADAFTDGSGNVYYEKVYLKTTDNAAATATVKLGTVSVAINSSSDALAGSVRVAISDVNGYLIGVWAATGAAYDKANAGDGVGSDRTSFTCYDSTTTGGVKNCSFTASGTPVNIAAANQLTVTNSTTDNYVNVYVYLDGEDEGCNSADVADAAALLGAAGIAITFTAAS